MTSIIGVGLQIALALIQVFIRKADKKAELQRDMIDLIRKHNEAVLDNVRLRKKYNQILKDIREAKTSSPSS